MKYAFSAGGIVIKEGKEVLVAYNGKYKGWVFPKGHIGDTIKGETKEEAALREVREETGVTGKIVESLKPISYWFRDGKETIKKTVYFFLMEYISENIGETDGEMEKVEWLTLDEAEERLTYKDEKKVLIEARAKLAKSQVQRV